MSARDGCEVRSSPARPEHMPADTPDFLAQAWVDCLRWASAEPEIIERWRKETGNKWAPPRSALDKMIDDATGAGRGAYESFVAWFNENIWGTGENAP